MQRTAKPDVEGIGKHYTPRLPPAPAEPGWLFNASAGADVAPGAVSSAVLNQWAALGSGPG